MLRQIFQGKQGLLVALLIGMLIAIVLFFIQSPNRKANGTITMKGKTEKPITFHLESKPT